ncbi:MAG: cation:H+ antiporter [Myxococcota bacterium]|jgi:cation:H+ antiporter
MLSALLIVLGIAGVLLGSDVAISAAIRLARRIGVPPLLVGLTLTSIGTSLPEIATNVAAGMSSRAGIDASGLLVGNIIGSCLSQITLLLGIVGLAASMRRPDHFRRDGAMMLVAAAAMFAVCADGVAKPIEAVVLLSLYAGYLFVLVRGTPMESPEENPEGSLFKELALAMGGLMVVVLCANLVVEQAIDLARLLELPEVVIGLILGLGTGIPELTVALQAARKGSTDLGLGNLIGSNITDPLLSFSAGVMLHEVTVPAAVLWFDFPVWLGASGLALWFIHSRSKLSRLESGLLIAVFLSYVTVRTVLIG